MSVDKYLGCVSETPLPSRLLGQVFYLALGREIVHLDEVIFYRPGFD